MRRAFVLILGLCGGLALGACSDNGQLSPPGNGCRDSSDCRNDEGCSPPVAPLAWGPVCGIPCDAQMACSDDAECPASAPLCLGVVGNCCGPSDALATECWAACTDDTACREGWRCRNDGRGCEPVLCDDGYACPGHTACVPDMAFAVEGCSAPMGCPDGPEAHGCLRDTCDRDGDCDADGKCVMGLCYDGYGSCMGAVP